MLLSGKTVQSAKPKDKIYRIRDGAGLFLQVEPAGGKYWRLRYFFGGKEKMLALGTYPEVSLANARIKRAVARELVADGVDPSTRKKEQKRQASFNAGNSLIAVATEWHENNKPKWSKDHAARIWRRIEKHAFDDLGERPVAEITALELLDVLRKVERRGTTELSHRLLQSLGLIFRYAVLTARTKYNPTIDLKGALVAHKAKNLPTITPAEIPGFITELNGAKTSPINKLAVRLLLLTFIRQGELRRARWKDINFVTKQWILPAENTKMRDEHIVPLSEQALARLNELKAITGNGEWLFPSQLRRRNAIMSENTINKIIHTMGYKGRLVGHGFRALASTTLNEHGFRSDIIERQLAHAERNKVRAAYNRAEYLSERVQMMQWWADHLDNLYKQSAAINTNAVSLRV